MNSLQIWRKNIPVCNSKYSNAPLNMLSSQRSADECHKIISAFWLFCRKCLCVQNLFFAFLLFRCHNGAIHTGPGIQIRCRSGIQIHSKTTLPPHRLHLNPSYVVCCVTVRDIQSSSAMCSLRGVWSSHKTTLNPDQ